MRPNELRDARKAAELRSGEFAALCGVTRPTVWEWESGRKPVPRYAQALIEAWHLMPDGWRREWLGRLGLALPKKMSARTKKGA